MPRHPGVLGWGMGSGNRKGGGGPGVLGWGMGSGNRKGGGGRGGRDYTIGFPSSRFYIPIGIYPAAIPYSTTRLITYRLFYH